MMHSKGSQIKYSGLQMCEYLLPNDKGLSISDISSLSEIAW